MCQCFILFKPSVDICRSTPNFIDPAILFAIKISNYLMSSSIRLQSCHTILVMSFNLPILVGVEIAIIVYLVIAYLVRAIFWPNLKLPLWYRNNFVNPLCLILNWVFIYRRQIFNFFLFSLILVFFICT